MSYRFNNGRGGVTCDKCNILFDADLSFKEYEESYGKTGHDGDFCVNCLSKKKIDKKKISDILNGVDKRECAPNGKGPVC